MPNWQPNREPVHWDWGAAREAVSRLNKAARRLREDNNDRQRKGEEAKLQWRGRFREKFDEDFARAVRTSGELADAMERQAEAIERASAEAEAEKRRREAEIARWEREKREEDRKEDKRWPW